MKKLYYLAHPYSPKPNISETENVFKCINVANTLMDIGFHIYAPIVMTHWLHSLKFRPYTFWIEEDHVIMDRCDGIILSGFWKDSSGCLSEKKWFEDQGKEVLYYEDILSTMINEGGY